MEIVGPVLLILVVGGAAMAWHFTRGRTLLQRWAAESGYTLVSAEYRWMLRGPFWYRSKDNAVYRVVVRDAEGRTRRGYVRCGSFWWGMLSDEADVEWTD